MKELQAELLSIILKSSSEKQFKYLVNGMAFLISIITATVLYNHFFGNVVFDIKLDTVFKTLLSPLALVWLSLFCLFYFLVYPVFSLLVQVTYRLAHPVDKKLSRHHLAEVKKGFKISGTPELFKKLKTLSVDKISEFRITISVEMMQDENNSVKLLSYFLAILLQYAIFYNRLMNGNVTLRIMFAIGVLLLLALIYWILPWIYRMFRSYIDDSLKKIIKEMDTIASQT